MQVTRKNDVIHLCDMVQAAKTSWFAHDECPDNYALVLENEFGEPIAAASYKYEVWIEVLEGLKRIHLGEGRHRQ